MQNAVSTYLKFVPFQEFNLWDVKRYYNTSNLKFDNVVTLADILIPYRKAVSKEEMIKNKWQIIAKINFGGDLFLRDFEEIHTYKGNVNLVPENAIIYSKINVRHGCIYYHEKGKTPFGVSSEYPTYTFDENKISGKFLHKILRSSAFKKLLNSKTSGISKARVKQDEFLDIQIPLPTLAEQQQIVDAYTTKIQQAQALQTQANNLEDEIEKYVNNELGFRNEKISLRTKGLSFINFENLNRWDINFLYQTENENKSKYPLISYNDLFISLNNGIPARNYSLNGTRFLKVADIKNNQIDSANIKFIEKFKENELIDANTLLITRKGTVGNSYYVTEDGKYTASSEIFIIKLNNKVDGNYIAEINLTEFIKKQYREKNTGTIMPSLSQEKLREILIPLPPIEKQREIVDVIGKLKAKLNRCKIEIEQSFEKAQQEFEQSIFN